MGKEKYFNQPSGTSVAGHFSEVPKAEIQRSSFDRSHGVKTTLDAGMVVPIFVDDVMPGDTFNMSTTAFVRMATLLTPAFENMYVDIHHFFCPYRLVMDDWQRLMGEKREPNEDNSGITVPQVDVNLATNDYKHIANAMGIPQIKSGPTIEVSSLPFRAYHMIWNEWYRDTRLQVRIPENKGNAKDNYGDVWNKCWPRGKSRDYFTSALPWPQAGDPVQIPIATSAPIVTNNQPIKIKEGESAPGRTIGMETQLNNLSYGGTPLGGLSSALFADETGLVADLTTAAAVTINDLRTAFQIQRLLERDARGGQRYIELILSHYGVSSPDARLQRPEYLGGGTQAISINPVASTVTTEQLPQGTLGGIGTGIGKGGYNHSFTEHGVVISMMSIRADLTYQQGLERMWSRKTRYDFYWPALANLGEQAILNKEIYVQGTEADNNVFGYQERFAEYRYKPSRVTGKMSSGDNQPLDYWHAAQDFSSLPVLNESFIVEKPPIERLIAVPSEPQFIADIWFKLKCTRPMPTYSVPGMIDHF